MRAARSIIAVSLFFAILCVIVSLLSAPSQARETKRVAADYLQARLLSGVTEFNGKNGFSAGLEIRLEDGWHAYWRTPGDGGLPPDLDWTESENLAAVDISYPAPQRFDTFGLTSFGYKNRLLLPLNVIPESADKPVTLALSANIMVCNEICVPQFVDLSLTIPNGKDSVDEKGNKESRHAPVLKAARDKLPHKGALPALEIKNTVAGPDALIVGVYSRRGYDNFDLFVETENDVPLLAAPEITVDKDDPRYAQVRIAKPDDIKSLAPLLMGKTVTITAVAGNTAIEQDVSL